MRYCFRHTDALWRVSFWSLVAVFAAITLWVIVSGSIGPSADVYATPVAQAAYAAPSGPGTLADLQQRGAS